MTATVTPMRGNVTKQLEALFHDGVLIDLDIGFWTARKRNTAEDLGIEKTDEIPDYIVGLGTKRLLPAEVTSTWTEVASHARTRLRKWSTLFPIGNGSFVPITALPKIEEALLEDQKKFFEARDVMLKDYDQHRQKMLADYPEQSRLLAQAFPARAEVERAFYFTWSAYEISVPKKISLAATSRRRAEARAVSAAKRDEMERQALARYHRELEQRVEQFLRDSTVKLRERVTTVCRNIAQRVREHETVSNQSLNTLRNAIEFFRVMNFVNDAATAHTLDEVEKHFLRDKTADDYEDNTRMQSAFATALDVVTRASDVSDVSDVTGEYRRRMIV